MRTIRFETIKKNCIKYMKSLTFKEWIGCGLLFNGCLGARVRGTTLIKETDIVIKDVIDVIDRWDVRSAQSLIDSFNGMYSNMVVKEIAFDDNNNAIIIY